MAYIQRDLGLCHRVWLLVLITLITSCNKNNCRGICKNWIQFQTHSMGAMLCRMLECSKWSLDYEDLQDKSQNSEIGSYTNGIYKSWWSNIQCRKKSHVHSTSVGYETVSGMQQTTISLRFIITKTLLYRRPCQAWLPPFMAVYDGNKIVLNYIIPFHCIVYEYTGRPRVIWVPWGPIPTNIIMIDLDRVNKLELITPAFCAGPVLKVCWNWLRRYWPLALMYCWPLYVLCMFWYTKLQCAMLMYGHDWWQCLYILITVCK